MSIKKAIIFDLWDTLVYNNDNDNILSLISNIVNINTNRENWKRVENAFMRKKYDDPLSAARDIISQFNSKNPIIIGAIADVLANHIKPKPFPDVIPVINKLADDYKLGIISNTPSFGMSSLKRFFEKFDAVSLSYETGMLKPEPKIFLSTLNSLSVKPENAIMVGDNYFDDIVAAKSIGMSAVMIKRNPDKTAWHETTHYPRTISTLREIFKYL